MPFDRFSFFRSLVSEISRGLLLRLTLVLLLGRIFCSHLLPSTPVFYHLQWGIEGLLALALILLILFFSFHLGKGEWRYVIFSGLMLIGGYFFYDSNHLFLRVIRHLLLLGFLSWAYYVAVWKKHPREQILSFYTFAFLAVALFTVSNLFADIQIFFPGDGYASLRLYLNGKTQLLYMATSLFIALDLLIHFSEKGVKRTAFLLSAFIILLYGWLWKYSVKTQWMPSPLFLPAAEYGRLPLPFYIGHLSLYIFFFLYHLPQKSYFNFSLLLVVMISISLQVDTPLNGWLIAFLFLPVAPSLNVIKISQRGTEAFV